MTPHLHPRSRLTTSLFGTTLLVSFLVVGMPHIFPCPAPRIKYAEADYEILEDGRRRRRRRQPQTSHITSNEQDDNAIAVQGLGEEDAILAPKTPHECPVPKPRGLIGEVLGFNKEKLPRPRVETTRQSRSTGEER